jgi:hypothetical protein
MFYSQVSSVVTAQHDRQTYSQETEYRAAQYGVGRRCVALTLLTASLLCPATASTQGAFTQRDGIASQWATVAVVGHREFTNASFIAPASPNPERLLQWYEHETQSSRKQFAIDKWWPIFQLGAIALFFSIASSGATKKCRWDREGYGE